MRDTLKTERLVLRPFVQTDWKALVEHAGNINVAKATGSLPHPYSHADAMGWIELTNSADFSGQVYGIANDTDHIIGCVGLTPSANYFEIGYWLAEDQWNKGFMSEAVDIVLQELARSNLTDQVIAYVFIDNPYSAKLLEKAGFKPRKTTLKPCLALGQTLQTIEFSKTIGGSDA